MIKGIGYGCDEEAVRVLQEVVKKCKWIPGDRKGEPVDQQYTLAVVFRLA